MPLVNELCAIESSRRRHQSRVHGEARPLITLVKDPPDRADLPRRLDPGDELDAEPPRTATDRRLEGTLARYLDLVWRVLRRAGLTSADAEDAAQDVFWVFSRRLNDVPPAAERSFLISTALRIAADRRRTKWYSVKLDVDVDARLSEMPLPDEALELRRAHAVLDAVLEGLPTPEREVFVLSEIEELSRSEVARCLAISEGTVASRLARARERVEGALKRWCAKRGRRP